jgi:asparagine synthase (glutamine-hydrolysing)
MAIRYLALTSQDPGDHNALRHHVAGAIWRRAFESDTLTVYVNDEATPVALDTGIILGHLFDRSDYSPRTELSQDAQQVIVTSRGRKLISRFWGGYVAFLTQPSDRSIDVLRDPSGTLPCYYMSFQNGRLFASDIEALTEGAARTLSVDPNALGLFLKSYDLRAPRTCLREVSELLAGFNLRYDGGKWQTSAIWSPWDYVEVEASTSGANMEMRLHQTVRGCIRAWMSRFDHGLLAVSGGLDSSIIAACLHDHSHQCSYLTLATDEATGDERAYARALAAHLGIEIEEAQYDLADIDMARSTAAHLPRPVQYAFGQGEHAAKLRLVQKLGIDALITGIGGDNVFCSMHSGSPLVDRLRTAGLGRESFNTLIDICALTGASVWEIALMAFKKAMAGNQPYRWQYDLSLLHPDLVAQAETLPPHPWLTPPIKALPGKAAHIAKLVRIQGTVDGFVRTDTPPQINPLLSQPIMETCLAIPTWEWVAGGRDRSVARRAFAADLPPIITRRRSKGGPDSFAFDVLDSHRDFVKDRLINGVLRRLRLIDPVAVHAALDPDVPLNPMQYLRLSGLAEAEAWVRHWGA